MASTDDNPAAIDDVQGLDIDDEVDIFDSTADVANEEDMFPQPQPESHTPPDANEEPRAVDGGSLCLM